MEKVQVESVEQARDDEREAQPSTEEPHVLEEICVEELAIDGICGVY